VTNFVNISDKLWFWFGFDDIYFILFDN